MKVAERFLYNLMVYVCLHVELLDERKQWRKQEFTFGTREDVLHSLSFFSINTLFKNSKRLMEFFPKRLLNL